MTRKDWERSGVRSKQAGEGVSTKQRTRRTRFQERVVDTPTGTGQPVRRRKESTLGDDQSEINSTSSDDELNGGISRDSLRDSRTQWDASEGDADFDGPFAVVIPARQE
jgi:hypothetical protein